MSRDLGLCLFGNIEILFSQSLNQGTLNAFPTSLVRLTGYTRGAVMILLAIAVPPLGEILRPYVAGAVFFLLMVAFLRVDPVALVGHLRRPGLALVATI
jgi:hypothetical protein